MRCYLADLSRVAGDTFISCYPNAGLPNPMSETWFDETPEVTAQLLGGFAQDGPINPVGGCCRTTPEYIAPVRDAVAPWGPRRLAER
jgi:5-methyltetrahydrofolate--homocysteine methyltransferase